MTRVVLDEWSSCSAHAERRLVFPDGCRDVIVVAQPNGRWTWFVSQLDDTARGVVTESRLRYRGFRLCPGVTLDERELGRAFSRRSTEDDFEALINEAGERDTRAEDLLAAFARCSSLEQAAKSVGVSTRTLQRWASAITGKPAQFWMGLARARRAAAAVWDRVPLIEVAANTGFADQAHMTREFRRWFSVTPRQVRARTAETAGICASGFGLDWLASTK